MTDDLPWFGPEPDDREPRPCRRHNWQPVSLTGADYHVESGQVVVENYHEVTAMRCSRCGRVRDPVAARRGKSSKRLGSDQERRAEKVYGWEKVGEFGTITDLRGTLMKVQQKATRAPVPVKWAGIFRALDAVNDNRTAAILLSFVAQGKTTEDFLLIRGRDWLALHGRDES